MIKYLFFTALLSFEMVHVGCSSKAKFNEGFDVHASCASKLSYAKTLSVQNQLNGISSLFEQKCYQAVILLGTELREKYRDKYFSILKESMELVSYEGFAKDYVMDSYERIFMSLLIAASYKKLNDSNGAKVELNKAYDESIAKLYSIGADSTNLMLLGVLWIQLGEPAKAEPFFRSVANKKNSNQATRTFANTVLNILNSKGGRSLNPSVQLLSRMPQITYHTPPRYEVKHSPLPEVVTCISDTGLLLDNSEWLANFMQRDSPEQDPVLKYKKAVRIPQASLYAGLLIVAGLYAAVGLHNQVGVALGALSLYGGYRTYTNMMAPDMRYWEALPQGVYISLDSKFVGADPCLRKFRSANYELREF